jgi:hypothetical protein
MMRIPMANIPPEVRAAMRATVQTLGKIGYRAISAAVSTALKGVGEITEEVDRRVKRGSKAAEKMANGQPYEGPDDESGEEPNE